MDDTHPEISKTYRRMLMNLSPEDRFLKGARMFNVAREMALASQKEGLSDKELKTFLLERFYGNDLSDQFKRNFLAQLK